MDYEIIPIDKGSCNRCGYCCKYVINVFPFTIEMAEWAKARNLEMVDSSETHLMVRIHHPCPHLKIKKGKYSCDIEKTKPHYCRIYPSLIKVSELTKHGLHIEKFMGQKCSYLKLISSPSTQETI